MASLDSSVAINMCSIVEQLSFTSKTKYNRKKSASGALQHLELYGEIFQLNNQLPGRTSSDAVK